ncbi:MAG: ABC-F family ATP-binding cassette domain-containing protein [Bacteroidales bacterium]|nr:ABC-F family ATP-binding cassette domain-containing protein [Bacteroidales bacterium]
MISVENLQVEFSGTALFEQVSFSVAPKERIGLAGKNGAGKTTLLRILSGEASPTSGLVTFPDDSTIGYLPQEKAVKSEKNILDETLTVFSFVGKLKTEYAQLQQEIIDRTDYESPAYMKMLERMDVVQHQLSIHDESRLEGKAVKVLKGLGFIENELTRSVKTFSPGWQMRMELAKLLLLQPDLLLLDEPTNHLDIEAIQWLEQFLKNYPHSVLLVSHDRTFLDNLTNRTLEINNGKVYDYKVPYSQYLVLREERQEQQKAAFNNQQKYIKETEEFIDRFRYKSTKAKQVQSRIKMLEKLDTVQPDDLDRSGIHFRFPPAPRSGKVVIEGENVSKSYGSKKVLNHLEFHILKGEKVAFVGRNGEGKTTLLKIIARLLEYEGQLKFGHNVSMGYYAQDQWEMLDPQKTVFESLDDLAVGEVRKHIKSILGSFLFSGEDVDKKVSVLSGGEKARLSLAKLLLQPYNLLVLDEPTNHLDLLSKDILKKALLEYDGTLILVSHDRDFLQGLTERMYEFKNHQIKEFRGSLEEYLEKKRNEIEIQNTPANAEDQGKPESTTKNDWQERKEKDRARRKLQNKLNALEQKIEEKESLMEELNEKLAHPENHADAIADGSLYRQHTQLQKEIEKQYESWEQIHTELENL